MQKHLQPLAARLRPNTLSEFVGQEHVVAQDKALYRAIERGQLHSLILWGPPGTGKTTLAYLLANHANAHVEKLSAVLAGVKDIRAVVERAKKLLADQEQRTVLFVDEVHRFNKMQQDAFLPDVESGLITLIGATTENPSFALNNALLSRARVYVLKSLTTEHLMNIIQRGLATLQKEEQCSILFPQNLQMQLAKLCDGDARQCLNLLEVAVAYAEQDDHGLCINEQVLTTVASESVRRFDNQGDDFYDQISALHKSVRGSDPNASLYWFSRMIDGGCDPNYIARRVLRMASEDIGNADPRALEIALNAWQTYERLGSPEGELAIAQAIIYLAVAAKSNATYVAMKAAMSDIKQYGSLPVPLHLRNAPTKLMKNLGYGDHYRYAHDEENAYAADECYFPEGMASKQYYQPVDRGLEIKIKQKLDSLKRADKK